MANTNQEADSAFYQINSILVVVQRGRRGLKSRRGKSLKFPTEFRQTATNFRQRCAEF